MQHIKIILNEDSTLIKEIEIQSPKTTEIPAYIKFYLAIDYRQNTGQHAILIDVGKEIVDMEKVTINQLIPFEMTVKFWETFLKNTSLKSAETAIESQINELSTEITAAMLIPDNFISNKKDPLDVTYLNRHNEDINLRLAFLKGNLESLLYLERIAPRNLFYGNTCIFYSGNNSFPFNSGAESNTTTCFALSKEKIEIAKVKYQMMAEILKIPVQWNLLNEEEKNMLQEPKMKMKASANTDNGQKRERNEDAQKNNQPQKKAKMTNDSKSNVKSNANLIVKNGLMSQLKPIALDDPIIKIIPDIIKDINNETELETAIKNCEKTYKSFENILNRINFIIQGTSISYSAEELIARTDAIARDKQKIDCLPRKCQIRQTVEEIKKTEAELLRIQNRSLK